MEAGMELTDRKILVKYSWLPCVARLRDNAVQANMIQSSVETSMI